MSAKRYTFDTNILYYSLDSDAGNKYRTAQHLVGEADYNHAVILLQTLGELSHSVRRKAPSRTAHADRLIDVLIETYPVVSSSSEDLQSALSANARHGLPFWDAMVWATARRGGCNVIFTEDFQDGRTLNGITFRNPFEMSSDELAELLV